MELRRILSSSAEVSVLGFSLDSAFAAVHPSEPTVHRLIGLAQAAGVRVFDTADSLRPAQTEAMLNRVDRFEPGTVWVLERNPTTIGAASARHAPDPTPSKIGARLRDSILSTGRREDLHRWILWRDDPSDPTWEEAIRCLTELEAAGAIAGWGQRASRLPEEGRAPAPGVLSGEISLLDRRWETFLRSSAPRASFFARDPLAAGRLDGSRWSSTPAASTGRGGPTPLRRLQEEAAPILAFGALTERHRRTLAQAAIQFVARMDGVGSVLAPLPSAERLQEIVTFGDAPMLTDEELARIPDSADELGPRAGPHAFEARSPIDVRGWR